MGAGAAFSGAVQVYKASVQDFDDMKVESDHGTLSEDEFSEKYGMSYTDQSKGMRSERYGPTGSRCRPPAC